MNKDKHLQIILSRAILLTFIILMSAPFLLESQDIPARFKPMKISGLSEISWLSGTDSAHGDFRNWINVFSDSRPVSNLDIMVDNIRLSEGDRAPQAGCGLGCYWAFMYSFEIYPGRLINVSLRTRMSRLELAGGQGILKDIVIITSPRHNEAINLRSIRPFTVRWQFTAGSGPLTRLFIKERQPGEAGPIVFDRSNVPGNSLDVPTTCLRPLKQYTIWLQKNNPNFVLRGNITPDSRIRLNYIASRIFGTT